MATIRSSDDLRHRLAQKKAADRRAAGETKRPYRTKEQIAARAAEVRWAKSAVVALRKIFRDAARDARVPKHIGSKWWKEHATAVEVAEYRQSVNAKSRERYKRTLDYQRAKTKNFKRSHPDIVARHHAERQQRIEASDDGSLTAGELARLFGATADCPYCEAQLTAINATLDHLVPLARGGRHSRLNVAVCCSTCNISKGAKLPLEYLAVLVC